jgi:hypothetical protein
MARSPSGGGKWFSRNPLVGSFLGDEKVCLFGQPKFKSITPLNAAGPWESRCPGIHEKVKNFLKNILVTKESEKNHGRKIRPKGNCELRGILFEQRCLLS